ncbi:TnpV protein [Pseudobacteroides cellulosolvens]|uniref:TnpV protein n=1 Tax=Pseudobacteroides cellulosolvens TaxID=35825 RepID=UPI0009DCDC90|nr:TnpV protein [Pseudobacteroides cellulosolvens]
MSKIGVSYTEIDGVNIPNIQISNNSEDDRPLGKYGRMAMEYLKEQNPQRYMILKMDGTLMATMHRVQEEAVEKIEYITQQMLKSDPMPNTEDIMEKTRHMYSLRSAAEEIVLNELIYKVR